MVSGIGPSIQNGMMGTGKDTKVSEEKDISFQNLLSNPKPSADQASVKDAGVKATEKKDLNAAQDNSYDGTQKRQAVKIEDATKQKELTPEEKATAEKAVGGFEEKVTEVLAEELDVTEDEIAAAMETLGLTFLDLVQPDQLAQLVGELTGTEEAVDLLTNQNLNGIMAQVSELATNLTEEAGIPIEELTALGMTETDNDEVIMTTEEVLPETEDFSKVMNAVSEEAAPVKEEATEAKENGPVVEKAAETKPVDSTERVQDVPDENEGRPIESDIIRTGDIETEAKDTSGNTGGNGENDLSSEAERTFTERRDAVDKEDTKGTEFHEASHAANTPQHVENQQVAAPEAMEQPEAARPLVDPRDLMEQFAEFARTSITENTSEIEMRLNPENLGRLLIHVTEQEGTVRASIQTQNVEVKEALESQLAVLRTTLEGQGMKVTEVEVTVASHEFEENLEKGNANTPDQEHGEAGERERETEGGRRRNINMNDLSRLQGLMTEEEELAAKIMRDNGNSVDYTA